MKNDHTIIRELARQYADIAADPIQDERRKLWADHLSLRPTRPPLALVGGTWDAWLGEMLTDDNLSCSDPDMRAIERDLRCKLILAGFGSDDVAEPWITVSAVQPLSWGRIWGITTLAQSTGHGGAVKFDEPIKSWDDMNKLVAPQHVIDEDASVARWEKAEEALDGILHVDRSRTPACIGFMADISTDLGYLRGIQQTMMDIFDEPEHLHELLAFMRDGILGNQQEAEDAGHFSMTSGQNQCVPYSHELPGPKANTSAKRNQLWCHVAAQEFTGVSPQHHDEFLLEYQLPMISQFGLATYGCCENLTQKIDILRRIPNLRVIAVTPSANVTRCAEQIGTDYALSWRPNPANTVCSDWNEDRLRQILREGLDATRGTFRHILLKDVHTVQDEPDRIRRFFQIAREVSEDA